MIAQMFFTDNDLEGFFEKAGYKTEMVEVETLVPAYHNRLEVDTAMVLHVVAPSGEKYPAKNVLNDTLRRCMVLPGISAAKHIDELLKDK